MRANRLRLVLVVTFVVHFIVRSTWLPLPTVETLSSTVGAILPFSYPLRRQNEFRSTRTNKTIGAVLRVLGGGGSGVFVANRRMVSTLPRHRRGASHRVALAVLTHASPVFFTIGS